MGLLIIFVICVTITHAALYKKHDIVLSDDYVIVYRSQLKMLIDTVKRLEERMETQEKRPFIPGPPGIPGSCDCKKEVKCDKYLPTVSEALIIKGKQFMSEASKRAQKLKKFLQFF